ncbi:GNAT family N-acetyltransferase, partial [Streptomyces nigra]
MDVELRAVHDSDLPVFFRQLNDPEALRMAAFTPEDPADRAAFDAHWRRLRSSSDVLR